MGKTKLKRLVRSRMSQTGENYTTALRHVREQAPTPKTGTVSIQEIADEYEAAWKDEREEPGK